MVTGQENALKVEEVVGEGVTDASSVGRLGISRLIVLRGEKEGGGRGNHIIRYTVSWSCSYLTSTFTLRLLIICFPDIYARLEVISSLSDKSSRLG